MGSDGALPRLTHLPRSPKAFETEKDRAVTTPRTRRTPTKTLLAALTACCLAPLALAACSPATSAVAATSGAPATSSPLPSCQAPGPASLPHSAGSLTQADTGVYCLGVGKLLDIFLTAPAGSTDRWSEISVTDTSVLAYGNNGVMTAMRDVTPGVVIGRSRGTTTVTSTLPDGKTWTATVVVS